MFSRLKVERGELAILNSVVDVRLEIMAIKRTTGLSNLISTPGMGLTFDCHRSISLKDLLSDLSVHFDGKS